MKKCSHQGMDSDVIFYAMLNLNDCGKLITTIDIHICAKCRQLFCDYKKIGEADVKYGDLGFIGLKKGEKWAVTLYNLGNGVTWELTGIKPWQLLKIQDKEFKITKNYTLPEFETSEERSIYKLIIVENNLNKTLEVGLP